MAERFKGTWETLMDCGDGTGGDGHKSPAVSTPTGPPLLRRPP